MSDTVPAPSGGRRRARRSTPHVIARAVMSSLLSLALITGLTGVFLYRYYTNNLTVLDVTSQLGTDRPEKDRGESNVPQEPLNILVMGSDTRDGEGNNIDGLTGNGTGLSDTTILIHLTEDRKHAYGISIPRDSLVDRPDCFDEDGEVIPGATDTMWNTAFSLGGPACTIRQLEQVTGVFVDHFVVVDFNGFRDMVDAIDGVEVCIPEDIDDRSRGIVIPAGTREVRGNEALNYVRARYTIGDGSDIGRIKRQQAFVAAMAAKVVSGGTLARPDRVIRFLNAATKSLVVDEDLGNVGDLGGIGWSFRNIGLNKIKFTTVPFVYSTAQPGRVEWTDEADEIWQRVIDDKTLGSAADADSLVISAGDDVGTVDDPSEEPTESESPTASPSPGEDPSEDSASDPDDQAEAEARRAAREQAGLCT